MPQNDLFATSKASTTEGRIVGRISEHFCAIGRLLLIGIVGFCAHALSLGWFRGGRDFIAFSALPIHPFNEKCHDGQFAPQPSEQEAA